LYFLIKEQSKDLAAELGVIGIAAQDVGGVIEVGFQFAPVIRRVGRTTIGTSRVCNNSSRFIQKVFQPLVVFGTVKV
jgi:hypothetical protein